MRVRGGDDLVAGPAVDQDRNLVAHGAGGEEQGRFLAEKIGDARAQAIDARVLAALLVADRRLGHGTAHRRRRPGRGVADEIDADRGRRRHVGARLPRRRRRRIKETNAIAPWGFVPIKSGRQRECR